MTTLKEAQESGDLDKLDALIRCPDQGKSKEVKEASKPRASDD